MPSTPYSPFENPIEYARESYEAEADLPLEPPSLPEQEVATSPEAPEEESPPEAFDLPESRDDAATADNQDVRQDAPEPNDLLEEFHKPEPMLDTVIPPPVSLDVPAPTLDTIIPRVGDESMLSLDVDIPSESESLEIHEPLASGESEEEFALDVSTPDPVDALQVQTPKPLSPAEDFTFPEVTTQEAATLDTAIPEYAHSTETLEAPVAPLNQSPPAWIEDAFPAPNSIEESLQDLEAFVPGGIGDLEPEELQRINREMAVKAMIERETLFLNYSQ